MARNANIRAGCPGGITSIHRAHGVAPHVQRAYPASQHQRRFVTRERREHASLETACRVRVQMITWLEPSPALREFVRWYVYLNRAETAQHPVIPVLETRLAFYPRRACRVYDHR